jgi:3-deoxy-D-manno-octulosonate 8-phosphate phosphatase (KDO 8-P phosphatase)
MDEKDLFEIGRRIKMLILDVDGVLTDGGIILDNEGNELKAFHVRDGHGLKMLTRTGTQVALITGRYSKVVERRAHELGIIEVYQRCHVKSVAYEHLIEKFGLSDEEVAYIGDDIVDLPILKRVGLPVAVADATDETKAAAVYITRSNGGRGAVREICDLILKAKGKWEELLDEYHNA